MKINNLMIEQTCSQDLLTQIGLIVEDKLATILVKINSKPQQEEVMKIKETAKFIGVSRTTLYNYEKQGLLIPKRFGNTTRYLKSEVVEFLKDKA